MGWLSSAIGAVGGIVGSVFGSHQASKAQDAANQMNYKIAQENREWREKMSNTAHQREVKDLREAGLNPILSVTGGSGASTPSSPVVSAKAYTGQARDIVSGINAGTAIAQQRMQEKLAAEQRRNMAADTQVKLATAAKENTIAEFTGMQMLANVANLFGNIENLRSQVNYRDNALTANTRADTQLKESTIDLQESNRLLNNAQRFAIIQLTPYQIGKLNAEISNIRADTGRKVSETQLNYIRGVTEKVYQGNLNSQTALNRLTAQGIPYDTAVKEVNAAIAEAGLRKRQDYDRYYGTEPDDLYGNVARVFGNITGLAGSGLGDLLRFFK